MCKQNETLIEELAIAKKRYEKAEASLKTIRDEARRYDDGEIEYDELIEVVVAEVGYTG